MTDKVKTKTAQIRKEFLPILKKHDVIKAGLFGSCVRGEETDKSDLDILVDFKETKSLFELAGLQIDLEEKVGRKVDVVPYNCIDPYLKDRILKEEVGIL